MPTTMFCPRCQKPLRRDDRLTTGDFEEGANKLACEECHTFAAGTMTLPPPKTYPPGCSMPKDPASVDGDLVICGLCRRAPFWGEELEFMRVTAEDLEGSDLEAAGPGARQCCRECVAAFRDKIRDRLILSGQFTDRQLPNPLSGSFLG